MSGESFNVTGQIAALRRYALALSHDPAEADDLVQETLVRAYEGRAGFRASGDLKSWLFSILHNCFVSARRSRKADERRAGRAAELAETESAPNQESRLRFTQIRAAFAALPAEQREVLHLVAIEGMAYGEAADVLGIPVGTLMSRLGRGRAALRALEGEPSNVVPLKLVRSRDDTR